MARPAADTIRAHTAEIRRQLDALERALRNYEDPGASALTTTAITTANAAVITSTAAITTAIAAL